jgi:hypothetical protein
VAIIEPNLGLKLAEGDSVSEVNFVPLDFSVALDLENLVGASNRRRSIDSLTRIASVKNRKKRRHVSLSPGTTPAETKGVAATNLLLALSAITSPQLSGSLCAP